jgi:hypothetical protein
VKSRAKPRRNSTRRSLSEFFDLFGGTPLDIIEMTRCGERPGPALCSRKCPVDVNDRCPHGCPSVLLSLMQYGYEWDDIVRPSL